MDRDELAGPASRGGAKGLDGTEKRKITHGNKTAVKYREDGLGVLWQLQHKLRKGSCFTWRREDLCSSSRRDFKGKECHAIGHR